MALSIRKVNRDVVPDSGHRGRSRTATDFDDHMLVYVESDWTDSDGNVEWDGWNEVDGLKSPEAMKRALADLISASNFKNVGIEKRMDALAGKLWFRVKSRTFRTRKSSGKGNGTAEGTDSRSGTVHPVQLKTEDDADTPKRQRKAS